MDLLVFSILYMYKAFQYRRLALKIKTAFEMHQSISSLYFVVTERNQIFSGSM